ncbi:hypothetical protein PCE1_002982 [Barthelona sp. PCE]
MKLRGHNIFTCNSEGCRAEANEQPLRIEAEDTIVNETTLNLEMLSTLVDSCSYEHLLSGASDLEVELPEELPNDWAEDEDLLNLLHNALNDIDVKTGALICPSCEQRYPIIDGIVDFCLDKE